MRKNISTGLLRSLVLTIFGIFLTVSLLAWSPGIAEAASGSYVKGSIDLDKCLGDSEGISRLVLIMFVCGPAALGAEGYAQQNDEDPQYVFDNIDSYSNKITEDNDGNGKSDALEYCMEDKDSDKIENCSDNCPDDPNPDQADSDGDGIGDACDDTNNSTNDQDNDGISDDIDNCPEVANEDQANLDGDSWGDACDNCVNISSSENLGCADLSSNVNFGKGGGSCSLVTDATGSGMIQYLTILFSLAVINIRKRWRE